MKSILAILVLVAACTVGGSTGDDGGGDETGGGGGGGGGMVDTLVDAGPGGGSGSGVACSGAAYDPCTDPAQCTSGQCHLFAQAGIQVCTQTCTPGDPTTCPMQNGQPTQCNNMGICRPAAANTCSR